MSCMQAVQHEGNAGADAPGSTEAGRVDQGPYEVAVELRGGGWVDAVASVRGALSLSRQTPVSGELAYALARIDSLVLRHAPSVLVLQGMLLQDLFVPDVYFFDLDANQVLMRGPWVFLKGALSKRWQTPLRIDGVVLASLDHVPEEMSREQVLSALLEAVR